MKSQKFIVITILLLILAVGYFYMKQSPVEKVDNTMEVELKNEDETLLPEDEITQTEDKMIEENPSSVQLNASNFTFEVSEVRAKVGEVLVVTVTNDQGVHDFVIDELGVSTGIIPEGESIEVAIPTDKPGIYEYYCSIGEHRKMGMKGTLIIE